MNGLRQLERKIAALEAKRAEQPALPPLVLTASGSDSHPSLIYLLTRHNGGHQSWRYECGTPPPQQHMIVSLQKYGCSIEREARDGAVRFRLSWKRPTR